MGVRVGLWRKHRRIDAFEPWCWRRLLRVPWTARRANQSILKEISPEYSLEGLMRKLKLQYFGHLTRRTDSLEKDPDAGKDWRQEEKGTTEDDMVGWHHQLYGCEFGWTPGVGDGQGGLAFCGSWGSEESDMTEWLNWTEPKIIHVYGVNSCLNGDIRSATCLQSRIFKNIEAGFQSIGLSLPDLCLRMISLDDRVKIAIHKCTFHQLCHVLISLIKLLI